MKNLGFSAKIQDFRITGLWASYNSSSTEGGSYHHRKDLPKPAKILVSATKWLQIYLFIYSFLFTNMGRPVNAQHGFLMVPRWPSSVDNAGPASLPPRLAWGGIPKENT